MHVGWKQLLKSLKSFVTLNFCGTFLYIWIRCLCTNILIYFSPKLYGVNLSNSIRHFNFPEGDIWIKMHYNDLKRMYIYVFLSSSNQKYELFAILYGYSMELWCTLCVLHCVFYIIHYCYWCFYFGIMWFYTGNIYEKSVPVYAIL